RLRRDRLAAEARSLLIVAGGLVLLLFGSGLIEGFVTPNPIPPALKIAIGIAYTAAVVAYAAHFGRRAARAELSADLDEHQAGYSVIPTGRQPQRRVRRGRVSESAGDLEPEVVVGQGTGQIIGRGLDGGDAEPAQARSQRGRRQQLRLGRGGRADLLDIAA